MPDASAGPNYRKNTRLKLPFLGLIRYGAPGHGARKLEFCHRFIYSPPSDWQEAPLPALPQAEPELVSVPPKLEAIVAQIQDLGGLFWDYEKFGDFPTEDEFVAHFVIPLLGALGWPPERVAVKWRDIDVAVFTCLPRTPENCRFIHRQIFRPGGFARYRDGDSKTVKYKRSPSHDFFFQLFHHALDKFFRVGQALHDDLNVHHWLARPALALAIDAMLPDQGHRVGDRVHGHGQSSAGNAHAGFEVFEFFLLFVEYRHRTIVTVAANGA